MFDIVHITLQSTLQSFMEMSEFSNIYIIDKHMSVFINI